ncbi:MAG: response regulator [Gammaproteobacteria bacterium]|nr:response regulator [Gammaproteobacteria bacterium]
MSDRTYIESEKLEKLQEDLPLALIVEDSISTRKSLEQFMKDLGFAVFTAKDGVEAINQIQLQTPSVVLTDLEMPRMNGLELSNHLRSNKETASIPIIMITSKSSDKHVKEAERIGISAYITKPYDDDELLECMNSLGVAAFVQ